MKTENVYNFAAIMACIVGVIGIWVLIGDLHFLSRAAEIRGVLRTISSSVVTDTTYGRYGPTSVKEHNEYKVDYEFPVNSQWYSGSETTRDNWSHVKPGGATTVYYNQDDPHQNRLELPDTDQDWYAILAGIVGTAYLLVSFQRNRRRSCLPKPDTQVGTANRSEGEATQAGIGLKLFWTSLVLLSISALLVILSAIPARHH